MDIREKVKVGSKDVGVCESGGGGGRRGWKAGEVYFYMKVNQKTLKHQ
ncbi:unnamed protein product [Onchocerca flexuosa]|uniref:Uncharacterized protein n=1 Tax=Onchocerca flexuosa TaxID=387005 RepID=A0A183HLZ8_9BILA|nr:unnamed protein product [Onchocerca flexuosa]